MSGIDEIKKKAKLSMDEMYETQMVGKLDTQPASQPDIHSISSFISSNNQNSNDLKDNGNFAGPESLKNETAIQLEVHSPKKPESLSISSLNQSFPEKRKNNNYKMTFYLTQDIYKRFNQLYAKLMYEGKTREKSEMICEAIENFLKTYDM